MTGSLCNGLAFGLGPMVNVLMEKFGARLVCIIGGIIGCIGFMSSILAPNVETLVLLYGGLAGFGLSLVFFPTRVSVNYHFVKRRSLANGRDFLFHSDVCNLS